MIASSSTPDTTTNRSRHGRRRPPRPPRRCSLPRPRPTQRPTARHRPASAPAAGPPRRSRARRGSIAPVSPHVSPLHQGELLPAEDRVTQFVDRQSPPADLPLTHLTAAAPSAAEHRDQRGHLVVGWVALEHPDVRLVWLSGVGRFDVVAHRGLTVRLVPVTHCVRSTHLTHSGMFPCFFGGVWAILRSSRRSAVPM